MTIQATRWMGAGLAALLLTGCARDLQVEVVNHAGVELRDVEASSSGVAAHLGVIAIGATGSAQLATFDGSADLKLDFEAAGARVAEAVPKDRVYGFKQVTLTVTTTRQVEVTSGITTF